MLTLRTLIARLKGMRTERVSVNLPFGLGGVVILPNEASERAAWSLYVELTTRIAVQPFNAECGLMRDVLTSLYSLFGLTRKVLHEAGPEVAHGLDSLGVLAIEILTQGIAPFTTKWHEKLRAHELQRPTDVSAIEHERAWKLFDEMRGELESLQLEMKKYAAVLAKIAGAHLPDARDPRPSPERK